jgi:hypothetical protein
MFTARCQSCGQPAGTKNRYSHSVKPIGYPNEAVLCSTTGCSRPALVWLNDHYSAAYGGGERIFRPLGGKVAIRVQ